MHNGFALGIMIMGLFGTLFAKDDKSFPPVPKWKPSITIPIDRIMERFQYYTDRKRDFVIFKNGTCVIVSNDLSDEMAYAEAKETLSKVFNYHPDMNPRPMDDGNIVIQFNHPVFNIVFQDILKANWKEIEQRHLDALARDEVLITALGPNNFDDFGKAALYGRCYFFMDAQDPIPIRIVRRLHAE